MNTPSSFDWANLRTWPIARSLRMQRFAKRFANDVDVHYFSGIYDSFEKAQLAAPKTKPLGYDNHDSARLYRNINKPLLRDYPAMHWLSDAIAAGSRTVFDLGGHHGMKFYAFEPLLEFPDDLVWTVCDVPAVVQEGRALAAKRGHGSRLHFTDQPEHLDGMDVLHAAGSLQYLPYTVTDLLARLQRRPRRLIINATALHAELEYFTLNSIGTAFCPYRIQRESTLVAQLDALGYKPRDRWTFDKPMVIPDAPAQYSLRQYTGLVFDRRDA